MSHTIAGGTRRGWTHALPGALALTLAFAPAARAQSEPDGGTPAPAEPALSIGNDEGDLQLLSDLLNTPVVTASLGGEESAALAPANVVSITRDELERRGWRSVSDVLSNQPGFYVVDDLVTPAVAVRGVSGGLRGGTRYLKIMINGVPVSFRPDLTSFIGTEFIPIEAVDRVEIAKGPLSAVYGANAFVATVNVITRVPHVGLRGEGAARLSVQRGVGYGGSLMTSYGTDGAELLLSVTMDQLQRSGLAVTPTFPEQDPGLTNYRLVFGRESQKDQSNPSGGFGLLSLHSEKFGSLAVQGGIQQLDAVAEFQLNSLLTHQSRVAVRNVWSNLRWEKNWADWLSSWVTAGYSQGAPTRDEVLYLTGTSEFSYRRNFGYSALDAAAGVTYSKISNLSLTAGVDLGYEFQDVLFYSQTFNVQQGRRKPGDSIDLIFESDVRKVTLSNVGAYLQAVAVPLEKLRISANARVDAPSLFAAQYSARLGVSYQWADNLVTKLIAGRAFQSPSAVMLYGLPGFGFANNVVGQRTQPSLDPLRPQTLHSVEAVVISRLFKRLALEGALYWQQLDDKIEFIQLSNSFVAQNLGRLSNVGAELNARLTAGRFTPFLSAGAQLQISPDPATGRNRLDAVPPPQYPNLLAVVGVNAALHEAHVDASVQLRAVGPRGGSQSNVLLNNEVPYTLPPFVQLDVAVHSEGLFLLDKQTETLLSVTARNLLDERHLEPGYGGFDIPTLGRTFLFELRQAF